MNNPVVCIETNHSSINYAAVHSIRHTTQFNHQLPQHKEDYSAKNQHDRVKNDDLVTITSENMND
jgi:hypothetical protein